MLTQETLKKHLHYDPETGVFTHRISTGPKAKVGSVAGSSEIKGYRRIWVCGRRYFAHRLAWLYTTGVWPKDHIDHINGLRDDNRRANLREATSRENSRNMKIHADNTSGFRGVNWIKSRFRWRAQIRVGGKRKQLGRFKTAEEASIAYEAEAKKLFGAFYRPQLIST